MHADEEHAGRRRPNVKHPDLAENVAGPSPADTVEKRLADVGMPAETQGAKPKLDLTDWPTDGAQWIARTEGNLLKAGVSAEAVARFVFRAAGARSFDLLTEGCKTALGRYYELVLGKHEPSPEPFDNIPTLAEREAEAGKIETKATKARKDAGNNRTSGKGARRPSRTRR